MKTWNWDDSSQLSWDNEHPILINEEEYKENVEYRNRHLAIKVRGKYANLPEDFSIEIQ